MKYQCSICQEEAVYKEDGIYYCKECIDDYETEDYEKIGDALK